MRMLKFKKSVCVYIDIFTDISTGKHFLPTGTTVFIVIFHSDSKFYPISNYWTAFLPIGFVCVSVSMKPSLKN